MREGRREGMREGRREGRRAKGTFVKVPLEPSKLPPRIEIGQTV